MEHDEQIKNYLERLAIERGIDLDVLCQTASKAFDQWEHLKEFGYAPGNYVNYCHSCRNNNAGVDKRATKCLSCAMKLYISAAVSKETWPILDLDEKEG
jgi:hypothetical protein